VDIGKEKERITIEPVVEPVPPKEAPARERPSTPSPTPAPPEKVPA
jgi:hypothetical protein